MPNWVLALVRLARDYPSLLLLFIGGGVGLWYWWSPATATVQPTLPKGTVPAMNLQQDVTAKRLQELTQENAKLRAGIGEYETTVQKVKQEADQRDSKYVALIKGLETKIDDSIKRQQAQPSKAPTPARQPMREGKQASAAPAPHPTPVVAPTNPYAHMSIQILRADRPPSYMNQAPILARAETAYLPKRSFARGKVLTGVVATTAQGGAMPITFAITEPFHPPYQLQGPQRNPLATEVQLQGCFAGGKAQANLSMSRVLAEVEDLICVFPDGSTFEQPLKGYIVDSDGKLGIFGKAQMRDSALMARFAVTGALAGLSEALALAKRTVIVGPLGTTSTTLSDEVGKTAAYSALGNTAQQAAQFYLQQARQMLPVIEIEANTGILLVLLDGVVLPDYPTQILLARR